MPVIDDLLVHRVDHVRYAVVPDGEFGKTNAESLVEVDVPCLIQPRSAAKAKVNAQFAVETTHVIYFSGRYALSEQEILVFRSRTSGLPADRYFELTGSRTVDELLGGPDQYTIVGAKEFDPVLPPS